MITICTIFSRWFIFSTNFISWLFCLYMVNQLGSWRRKYHLIPVQKKDISSIFIWIWKLNLMTFDKIRIVVFSFNSLPACLFPVFNYWIWKLNLMTFDKIRIVVFSFNSLPACLFPVFNYWIWKLNLMTFDKIRIVVFAFNKEHQALYVPRCWCHWSLNSSSMTPVKICISLQTNLDLTYKLFLSYFNS